ncbi:tellurite resistance TerB family protein [Salinarimonas sp. NSM]|uniref:tellurite resistance TerB family protein n=1 Tax=Salinarimonas sp. NSM TaxID=3458003 RepID=UPI0040350D2A
MLDAKKLLDQVLGSARAGDLSGLEAQARRMLGQGGGSAGAGSAGGGTGDLLKGGLAGGVVGLLLGSKKARKFAGKTAGTALKIGGVAAVAGLAYAAWRNRQAAIGAPVAEPAGHGATHLMPAGGAALLAPPADSGFAPANAPGGEEALARAVLVAMIQGAKADGHIDGEEQARIFAHIEQLGLDAEAKAFVMDELAAPLDIDKVVRAARTPEMATELYAASLLAMVPDHPAERAYLDMLAARLELDRGLAAEVERAVMEAT